MPSGLDTTMPNTVVYTHDEYGQPDSFLYVMKMAGSGNQGKINNANGEIRVSGQKRSCGC